MKKLLSKYWPVIGIGAVLLMIGFYLFKARYEIIEESILSNLVPDQALKLDNIHYIQNNPDEGVKWTLDAKEVKFSRDRQRISFKNFRLKLEPESRPSIELSGRGGDYDKTTSEISLRGELNGSTDNGYRIITEHILYSQKHGYLNTEEHVEIFGPFFSVSGQGFYFNLDKETFKVKSHVTTLIDRDSLVL